MSDNDDPFSAARRRGKTIIRPNPGAKWAEEPPRGQDPYASPQDTPPPAPSPPPAPGPSAYARAAPSGGQVSDPWQRAGPGEMYSNAPPPGYEYGQNVAPALHRPPPPNQPPPSSSGQNFAPESGAPQAGPEPVQEPIARSPDFGQIRVPNKSPIARAAAPLLLLLGRLELALSGAQFDALMNDVYDAINRFGEDMRAAGIVQDQINVATYALCATSDDIVQNMPSDGRHQWVQYSMLTQFFGQTNGGVEFFDQLQICKQDPGRNFGVLEVMHSCMSLGFRGKYRAVSGGIAMLEKERRDLHDLLRRVRPRPGDDLSPHWKGLAIAARRVGAIVPTWAVASVAAALLLGGYLTLRLLLSGGGEVVSTQLVSLFPTGEVQLVRAGYQPSAPLDLPPTALFNQMQASLSGLDGLEVIDSGSTVLLRMRALFGSGTADLQPEFRMLVEQVASRLDGVNGEIIVVGHTDNDRLRSRIPFADNYELSVARAESVATVIGASLTRSDRIRTEGRGDTDPIAPNTTREGKALNRRVEVFLKPTR